MSTVRKQSPPRSVARSLPVSVLLLSGALIVLSLLFAGLPVGWAVLTGALLSVNIASYAACWAALVGRRVGLPEGIAVGAASTLAIPTLVHVLLASLPGEMPLPFLHAATWLVGPLVGVVVIIRSGSQGLRRVPLSLPALLAGVVATFAAVGLNRWQFGRYAVDGPIDYSRYHPDLLFLQELAIANGGSQVGQIGVLSDWPAKYHWLSYAWSGVLESTLPLQPFVGLTRVLPLLSILGIAFAAVAIVTRFSKTWWVPILAALLVTCGRLPADSSGLVVNWDSPSETSSTLLLLVGLILATRLPTTVHVKRMLGVAVVLGFVTMGFKSSTGVVLIAALVVVALAGTLLRRPWARVSRGLALSVIIGSALAFGLFLAGNGTGQALEPRWASASSLPTLLAGASAAVATLLAFVPSSFGALLATRMRRLAGKPITWFAIGGLVCGVAAMLLLEEAGPNSRWFINCATALVWVSSCVAADRILRPVPGRTGLLVSLLSFLGAGLIVLAWAIVCTHWTLEPVASQLAFIALWLLGSVVLAVGVRMVGGLRQPLARCIVTVALIAGICTPLWTIVAERAFDVGPRPIPSQAQSATEAAPLALPLTPAEIVDGDDRLTAVASPGDVVALSDDALLPVLFGSRTIPFVSSDYYAPHAGPAGTAAEYDRRRSLVSQAIASGDDSSLCTADVRWVVTYVSSEVVIRPTVCGAS